MKGVLVDTSVLIEFLRIPHKKKSQLIGLVEQKHPLFISIITHTELYAGASVWESKRAKDELEMLLSGLTIIPLTTALSEEAGHIRATYSADLFDSIIAATAIVHRYPLATINVKDFQRIRGLTLLAHTTRA